MHNTSHQTEVVLAFGANLGDRVATIQAALDLIADFSDTVLGPCSTLIETAPEGMGPDAAAFLNGVAIVYTGLGMIDFFQRIQDVEYRLGRRSKGDYQNRSIDIDIIFWGNACMDTPLLQVPHPRYAERAFVCMPLLEIDPDRRDPRSGQLIRDRVNQWMF